MKYLLMCCHEEKKLDTMPKSECDAVMEETMAYCEALKKSGHLVAVEQLEPVQTAMTVRVRNGVPALLQDRKSTRLNSSHLGISYAVFCLKKKTATTPMRLRGGKSTA